MACGETTSYSAQAKYILHDALIIIIASQAENRESQHTLDWHSAYCLFCASQKGTRPSPLLVPVPDSEMANLKHAYMHTCSKQSTILSVYMKKIIANVSLLYKIEYKIKKETDRENVQTILCQIRLGPNRRMNYQFFPIKFLEFSCREREMHK